MRFFFNCTSKLLRKHGTYSFNKRGMCAFQTTTSVLSNGVRLATETTCSNLVSVGLFADAGPRFETLETHGCSQLIEHLAFKRDEVVSKLSCIAATLSVDTYREYQVFRALCLPNDVEEVIHILTSAITDFYITERNLYQAKLDIELDSLDSDNNHKDTCFDYLHQAAFSGTPLAKRVVGTTNQLCRLGPDEVICFMKENYLPHRLALAVSGCVDPDLVATAAQQTLGKLEPDTERCLTKPDKCVIKTEVESSCRYTSASVAYRNDDMPNAHMIYALEAPGIDSADYLPMLLATHVIGSWDRSQGGGVYQSSPLASVCSLAGWCQSYKSFYLAYRGVGLWGIYFVAPSLSIDDMFYIVHNTWLNLCMTLYENQLIRAKRATYLSLSKNFSGSVNSCNDIGRQLLFRGHRPLLSDLISIFEKIQVDHVKAIADEVIYDKKPVIIGVGPVEGTPEFNRASAGLYWLRA